jgi:chromosome segregation ATPase
MNDQTFALSYMKCQEAFLVDILRKCIAAEAKVDSVNESANASYEEMKNKNIELSEQVSQLLAGLESTTIQRDNYREEHSKYRDEILSLGDLKQKCEKIEMNYEEQMKNYNLLNEAYQKLQVEYQTLFDSKQQYEKNKNNLEEQMKNYNLLNEAYQKLQDDYQTLLDSQQQKTPVKEKNK